MKRLTRSVQFFENNLIISALRNGLTLSIPFLLAGSFASILLAFPIGPYQLFLHSDAGALLLSFFNLVYQCTLGSISFIIVITISYAYSHNYKEGHSSFYILTSVCAYIACTYNSMIAGVNVFEARWSFTAIVATLTVCSLLRIFLRKALGIKLYTQGAGYYFNMAMQAFLPIVTVLLIFALAVALLDIFTNNIVDRNVQIEVFSSLFSKLGSGLLSAVLYVTMIHLLWFFGIHGTNIMFPVALSLFGPATQLNTAMAELGHVPTEIFNYYFFNTFVYLGGSGACICLLFAMLLVSKQSSNRKLAKLAAVPVVFNINELFVLGIPILFNPLMAVPFLIVPISSLLISAAAMKIGLVPISVYVVDWTVPPLISGYVTTGSIAGSILQLVCIGVGVLIYIPFIRQSEKNQVKSFKENLSNLIHLTEKAEKEGSLPVFSKAGSAIFNVSKMLTFDLKAAMENKELKMYYQPQVNSEDHLFGVEALLRWKHPVGGYIHPPLIVSLACEDGFMNDLGEQIIEMACRDLSEFSKQGCSMHATVNVLPNQLEDPKFCMKLKNILQKYDLGQIKLGLEFTEQLALCDMPVVNKNLEELRDMGILLIMDDFGVGHSSMMYLQNNYFDVVKLDGKLVQNLLENTRSENITKTITSLAENLNFNVVAEYVETKNQRDKLEQLGCHIYQGYYYSKAIPPDEFIVYAQETFPKKLNL